MRCVTGGTRHLAVLLWCVVPAGHSAQAYAQEPARFEADGWRLQVRRDAFTDRISCRLTARDRRILFRPGAVGFRFGRGRDTTRAWYRVDDGAAVRWQDRYPALVAAGVEIDGPGLADPTGGIVWIPLADVIRARTVTIRPAPRSRLRTFVLGGLAAMRDASVRAGCGLD